MGKLWKALSNKIRGARDDAAESLKDPVREGKFAIEDSEKEVIQFQSSLSKHIAATNLLKKQLADTKTQSKKYDGFAKQAAKKIQGGDSKATELLQQAVTKKNEADATCKRLQNEVTINEQSEKNLRKQLNDAKSKIARAKQNIHVRTAQLQGAEMRKKLAAGANALGASSGLGALDDLDRAVDEATAEADAIDSLNASPDDELEAAFGDGSVEVDDDMAKYLAAASK